MLIYWTRSQLEFMPYNKYVLSWQSSTIWSLPDRDQGSCSEQKGSWGLVPPDPSPSVVSQGTFAEDSSKAAHLTNLHFALFELGLTTILMRYNGYISSDG